MKAENIEKIKLVYDENKRPSLIYIFGKDGEPIREVFSKKHLDLFKEYAEANGKTYDPKHLENLGISGFLRSNKDKMDALEQEYEEALDNYVPSSPVTPDPGAKADGIKGKTIAAGIGVAAVLAGGIGALAVSCSKNDEKKEEATGANLDFDTATFAELISALGDSERGVFFNNVYEVTNKMNTQMLSEKVFALQTDGDAVLQFTYGEVMAAKLALNTYTNAEIIEILGADSLDETQRNALIEEVQINYRNFNSKMNKFAMNGKAASGVATLIEDEGNREFFTSIEDCISEFNTEILNSEGKPREKADLLIRTFAYYYTHGINGVDTISNDEAALNRVKNLSLNMVLGYINANTNGEYSKYLKVSTAPGDFDDKFVANEASQVQKGSKLKDYFAIAEKGVCTLNEVEEHLASTFDIRKEATDSKMELSKSYLEVIFKSLTSAGETELAKEVSEVTTISDELKEKISKVNQECSNAVNNYEQSLVILFGEGPTAEQVINAAEKDVYANMYKNMYGTATEETVFGEEHSKLTLKEKIAKLNEKIKSYLSVLYNNRLRGVEKIKENSSSSGAISKEEWDKKTKEEKLEYAKDNGELVETKKEEVSVKVDKEDLTPAEKEEAEKQEEQIKDTIIVEEQEYIANVAIAASYGIDDVEAYCKNVNLSQTILEDARAGKDTSYNTYINASKSSMTSAMSKRNFKSSEEKKAYEQTWNAYIKDRVDGALKVYQDELKIKQEAEKEIEELNKKEETNNKEENVKDEDVVIEEEKDDSVDVPVVEEMTVVPEVPSEDMDDLLNDPQLQPPIESVAPDVPVIESYSVPIVYESAPAAVEETNIYTEDEIIAMALLGLEEAEQEYEKALVKTL